ncbi:hypothetical protein Dda_7806 [Drechslerella dactyloides]|uniref:Uncharacterized protein n=1 Tax=Drechslerella dactyloides TaxID=74499 RepID=A0AAD6IQX1_DREDA|nr:hypothetical protein Dda_7806 [Drechslerella dactyloides]
MLGFTNYLPILAVLSTSLIAPGAASPALLKRTGECEPFRMKGMETVPIPGALEDGGKAVLIEGWYLEGGKKCAEVVFSNCTKNTKDQALHIAFRGPNQIVALNDKHNDKWGKELDSKIKPLDSVYPRNAKGERKLSMLVTYGVDNNKPYYEITYFTFGSCLVPKDQKKKVVRFYKRPESIDNNINGRYLHFENKGVRHGKRHLSGTLLELDERLEVAKANVPVSDAPKKVWFRDCRFSASSVVPQAGSIMFSREMPVRGGSAGGKDDSYPWSSSYTVDPETTVDPSGKAFALHSS